MKDDTIKRSDAIDAIECVTWYHQNRNKDMVEGANSAEHQAWYKSQDIYEALNAVPSADRPSAVDLSSVYSTAYKSGYEKGKAEEHRWWSAHCAKCTDADRPQGEWIDDDFVGQYRCSECDYYAIDEYDYCPNCGCRMKGADDE